MYETQTQVFFYYFHRGHNDLLNNFTARAYRHIPKQKPSRRFRRDGLIYNQFSFNRLYYLAFFLEPENWLPAGPFNEGLPRRSIQQRKPTVELV